ncbi:MAG TPA: NAD(P)-binding domain-containing protein [Actinomycetota bacterium]|jgi:putative flavoprotein involved in K+ transport|nr:NAD(P)-binding domain-containing protein [Actinomycetota bacterium]
MKAPERFETVIVGGGQAGLAIGYHLMKRGRPGVILDASERIGDAWRTRWDSLRLFTPAKYDGLPGWRFPGPGWSFPTKDEMADYLEAYASRFALDVRTGVRVDRLSRQGHRFVLTAGERRFEADDVVIASGAHHIPKVPPFAFDLDRGIVQMHSKHYRNPSQLREGPVLVVGLGNSGAEIAFELSRRLRTIVAGEPSAQIPFRHGGFAGRVAIPGVRFLGHHVLTRRTPIGRRLAAKFEHGAAPLIRVRVKELLAAGVERVPRVIGVRDGLPLLQDGRVLEVSNVIWCTGFRQDLSWIDLPSFGQTGPPPHVRGVVPSEAGLYFMGLRFQFSESSDTLVGLDRDGAYVAKAIALRQERSLLPEDALVTA